MSPIKGLLRSRKFLLLLVDTFISLTLYLGAQYLKPETLDDIKFVIASLQPVFVALITAIAVEDAAAKRAGKPPASW